MVNLKIQDIEEDYIITINQKVNNYFTASDQTLKTDYFKYRFKIKSIMQE